MRSEDIGVSRSEYDQFNGWLESAPSIPEDMRAIGLKMTRTYWSLFQKESNILQLRKTLSMLMGFVPKSEKGSQGNQPVQPDSSVQPAPEGLKEAANKLNEAEMKLADLEQKRKDLKEGIKRYGLQIGALKRVAASIRLRIQIVLQTQGKTCPPVEPQYTPPAEAVFSTPVAMADQRAEKKRVDRQLVFGQVTQGMHSAYDETTRHEMKIQITQVNYKVETVTDPKTGKSFRASMDDEGPAGSSLTWVSYASLLKMHAGFAQPIHRIEMMLGHEAFSAGKIYRSLEWMAEFFLPIYLYLPEALSESDILSGDDTPAKVLDLTETPKKEGINLHQLVDEALKWRSSKANGKGDKKALHVTLITGRTTQDPRSTIHFFRTHIGSYGNLLTRILELRSPKKRKIIIQGDLSSSNKPESWIRDKFEIYYAGCGAHARRPIFRYRDDDQEFCYYVLQCFLHIAQAEQLIDIVGRTEKNIRKYRRYAKMSWQAIYNRCLAAITGKRPTPTTHSKQEIRMWPPKTYLHDAARYIIDNYEALTFYLNEPRLPWTTNDQERGLRFEKCLEDAAKFKGNRNGRVVLDILRTMLATCTTAEVEPADYMRWCYKNRDVLAENPQDFTPFAYALYLDRMKTSAHSSSQATASTLMNSQIPGSVKEI